jgi:hypothetical protein
LRKRTGKGDNLLDLPSRSIRAARTPESGHSRKLTLERSVAASNKTILVVDDEEIIREITSEILRQSGYRVLTADCGEEGHEHVPGEHKEIESGASRSGHARHGR